MTPTRRDWIGSLAVLCLLIGSGRAFGQMPINNGHATDANNQVNSGGYNQGGHWVNGADNGNNNLIEQRNVSGLAGFQGNLPPGEDPRAFSGFTQSLPSETLNHVAAPNVSSGSFTTSNSQVTPYYDYNRFVAPPAYSIPLGATGSFTQGSPPPPSPNDDRLGIDEGMFIKPSQPGDGTPPAASLSLSADQSVITASPLYGVKQWYMDSSGNMVAGSSPTALGGPSSLLDSSAQPPATFGAGSGLTSARISQIRGELSSAANAAGTSNDANSTAGATNPPGVNAPGTNAAGAFGSGLPGANPLPLAGGAVPVNNKPLSAAGPAGAAEMANGTVAAAVKEGAINGQSVSTGQSTRYLSPILIEPGKQSTQYHELQDRLRQYQTELQNGNLTDEQAWRISQEEQKTIAEMNKPAGAGSGTPGGGRTAIGTGAATTRPLVPPRNTTIPPVNINSLSEGIQSRGLSQILKDAEDLVRAGKYKEALDQYNQAAVIVPNNPMILLGRANAELGANLYARAEADLRDAYGADTALMMGKFNINDLIGAKRIGDIEADLASIAEKDKANETPMFLLAYIDYNTGQTAEVAARLESAERLNGGKDPLIESLFQHWNLSTTTQPASDK